MNKLRKIFNWWWKETVRLYKDEGGFLGLSLLAWAVVGTVVGAGVSAYSAYAQGQAQAQMASYNALIARQNADLALEKSKLQKTQTRIVEKRHREATKRTLATQRLLYGKAGVTGAGTPLLVGAVTAMESEIDALAIRYAGSVEQANILAERAGYKQQETIAGMRGSAARTAGYLGAGSALLTGLSKFAGGFGGKPVHGRGVVP